MRASTVSLRSVRLRHSRASYEGACLLALCLCGGVAWSAQEDSGWHLRNRYSTQLNSDGKLRKVEVRLFWGQQRMGVLAVRAGAASMLRDIGGWNWCVFAYDATLGRDQVIGWEMRGIDPPGAVVFAPFKGKYWRIDPVHWTPLTKALVAACNIAARSSDRFQLFRAKFVAGSWKVSEIVPVKKRIDRKSTLSKRNH